MAAPRLLAGALLLVLLCAALAEYRRSVSHLYPVDEQPQLRPLAAPT